MLPYPTRISDRSWHLRMGAGFFSAICVLFGLVGCGTYSADQNRFHRWTVWQIFRPGDLQPKRCTPGS